MSLPALAIGLANMIFGMKRRVQDRPGYPCNDALLFQPPCCSCAGCGLLLVPWSWAWRDTLGGSAPELCPWEAHTLSLVSSPVP